MSAGCDLVEYLRHWRWQGLGVCILAGGYEEAHPPLLLHARPLSLCEHLGLPDPCCAAERKERMNFEIVQGEMPEKMRMMQSPVAQQEEEGEPFLP